MNVRINRVGGGPVTFEDFADKHGLVLEVNERTGGFVGSSSHYYAKFEGVDISDGCMALGVRGDGHTPEEAIANFKPKLLGKTIRIGYPKIAIGAKAIYVEVPTEWK